MIQHRTGTLSYPLQAALLCALLAVGLSARADFTPLVVGGEDAGPDYPWMAALLEEDNGDMFQTCGASLIASHWLITAAHCVEELSDAGPLEVILDQPRLSDGGDDRHDISAFFIHPDYNSTTLDSDIALLRLAEPVSLPTAGIPDALMQHNEVEITTSDNLELLGWGRTGPDDEEGSDDLQHVHLDWLDNQSCNEEWGGNTITENMICAWEPDPPEDAEHGQEACPGDSGGPLFITRADHPWITGIVSFGEGGCGFEDHKEIRPGGYTRVINFVDWIEETTDEHGEPVVDTRPDFQTSPRYLKIGEQSALAVGLRNNSLRNEVLDTSLTITLPHRLQLSETMGEDWSCDEAPGDNTWECGADSQTLDAGETFIFDLVVVDIGDGEETVELNTSSASDRPDYRPGNRSAVHSVKMVLELPSNSSSNSGLFSPGPLVLTTACLLLIYRRRSQLSSHSRRRSASGGAPRQAR